MNYIEVNYVKDPSQFPSARSRLEAALLLHPLGTGPTHQHARLVNNIMREVEGISTSAE